MKKLTALLIAVTLLCVGAAAYALHYGWAFMIYDLDLAIIVGPQYDITDAETLAETNSFLQSGNVKPQLILEVSQPETRAQMSVYCAELSPYDNVDELTQAYAQDLGAVDGATDANGTTWRILSDQEFGNMPCSMIISSFENANAQYILLLSEDGSAYIISMITFDGRPPETELDGISFSFSVTGIETETEPLYVPVE